MNKNRDHCLSHQEVGKFYDRFGIRQDFQKYEQAAIRDLIKNCSFSESLHILEFGCGTGLFAKTCLDTVVPHNARYIALDISDTMVKLANKRVQNYLDRVDIQRTDGTIKFDFTDKTFDLCIANYVLDLLTHDDIQKYFQESYRVLKSNGQLGVISLSFGKVFSSRILMQVWKTIHRINAKWVGGCRPLSLSEYVDPERWESQHHRTITEWGISSEVMVLRKK